ncbi:hypothetical protein LCGC14_1717420 [marine sediment metagenome]|uniref:Uncharacterized protein n=1 Tax=marine sediment metagenome TaxID=412755 RepID=A0A0F9I119_9ZZZZ
MAIKKDRNGLVNIQTLTKVEQKIFIKFLEMEKARHQEDIDHIEETIAYMRVKKKKK